HTWSSDNQDIEVDTFIIRLSVTAVTLNNGVVFTDLDFSSDLLSADNIDGDSTQSSSDSASNLTESLSENDHDDDPSPDDKGDNVSQDDGGDGLTQDEGPLLRGVPGEDLQIAGSARTASVSRGDLKIGH
ncbi:MAG: hypothetical protein Q9177_005610, partial [Variospora cf. flavescens]